MSNELAKQQGAMKHSKVVRQVKAFQFDMWKGETTFRENDGIGKDSKSPLKNTAFVTALIAPMPTASTSQILGCNECFEPFTSNAYTRRTLAGEFTVVNHRLLKKLVNMGLWSEVTKYRLIKEAVLFKT